MKTARSVKLWPILVSAITSTAVSAVWFTLLFREPYMEGLGRSAEQLARGPSTVVASALQLAGNIALACALAHLLANSREGTRPASALRIALVCWLGFVAAVLGPMYAFQAFSLAFFAITSGAPLLSLLISASIISFATQRSGRRLEAGPPHSDQLARP